MASRPLKAVVAVIGLVLTVGLLAAASATTTTLQATAETEAAPAGTKTLMAAGDIACRPGAAAKPGRCQHRATGDLLAGADAVAPLGDLQYPDGRLQDFNQAYDPTWGQHAAKSYPAPGNHEYHVAGAKGYFDYWASQGRPTGGAGKGYHSFDLGSWHAIALNSNCSQVSCAEGSPQNNWLETDLAATTERCILAYWHHPRFNSGTRHGEATKTGTLWDDLYAARADIILNGHDHTYQRYAKQSPAGQAVSNGIRQFIVGTGGMSLSALGAEDANFEVGNDRDFGVLKLTLASDSYSWQFVGLNGAVLDSGGPVACN